MGDADPRAAEDALLRSILAVALKPDQVTDTGHVVLLSSLASDMAQEAMTDDDGSALLINRENLDRVVVSRLIESPPPSHPLPPLAYLMRCYTQAAEEGRSRAVQASSALQEAVTAARELVINYACLALAGDGIIPHLGPAAEAAAQRGALQLLDSLDARVGYRGGPGTPTPSNAPALPPGFLEELAAKFEADGNLEGLQDLVVPIAKELARRVRGASILGEFTLPLSCLRSLLAIEPIARALVTSVSFLPDLRDITGRGIESPGSSWLGPCFCPGPIDDPLVKAVPSVGEQCFTDVDQRRPGDVQQSMRALQLAGKQLRGELAGMIKGLLGKATREATVGWLAGVVEGNGERGKMQWDPQRGASHNFFLNHNAVMLALAGPFLESPNFWKRVDVRFVAHNARLDFKEDTKLGASVGDDEVWRERVVSSAGASTSGGPAAPPDYHFICECFFLTLKSLHLGVVKMVDDLRSVQMELGYFQRNLAALEAELDRLAGSPMAMPLQLQLRRAKAHFSAMQSSVYSMTAVLQDADFMGEVLAFYRLVACWLLSVANPGASRGGPPVLGPSGSLPLPADPPLEFTCLPEWFLEDIVDVLLMVSRAYPPLLMNARVEEIMLLMLATMDQPRYVRSSHMRAKMAELLHLWLPQDDVQTAGRLRRFAPRGALASTVSNLFQGHPLVCERLVPSLLRLYVDVEVMDVRNNFYEKFMYRQLIGEVLGHLWDLPPHREAWKQFAAAEGTGAAAYVRFTNMLITDATYLLDESLKKVEEIRNTTNRLADPTATAAMAPQELRELQGSLDQVGSNLKALLTYAQVTVGIMEFSTTEVSATFLLPEMVDRTATMLNYFMSLLTGPQRRRLALRDPEKYSFRPRDLLLALVHVYVNLAGADREGTFPRAIAADQRSYSQDMFGEAAKVLGAAQMLSPADAARLDALDAAVQRAAQSAAEQEDLLNGVEIPEEFQDPIMNELMTEPVLLPTSGTIMDKAHITRHLLTDQRDPMSRAPLKPEDLVPQPELKARIEAWVRETLAARRAAVVGQKRH